MKRKRGAVNRPLKCTVKSGVLTIEIGVETLAFAALRAPFAWEMTGGNDAIDPATRFSIPNARGFAKDVICEMLDEAEDGSTPLSLMLDSVCQQAVEQGSEHFRDNEDDEP